MQEFVKFAGILRKSCLVQYRFMRFSILLFVLGVLLAVPAWAQRIAIELGKSPLPINQYYTVSIRLHDQVLQEYSPFPEIEGFKKSTKFSSTKTIITGGKTTSILTITQNYAALNEGDFVLKPFSMKVNGQTVASAGATIKVQPMATAPPQSPAQPGIVAPADLERATKEAQEFVDKADNAFLTLYTDKKEVYVGEGLNVTLYFYLANEDQRLLDFYDFTNQIEDILRQLKQPNVWEETFEFTEITPENVLIKDKPFLRFKLYEAVLYPLNAEPLRFPPLSLKMIKYKVAQNPTLLSEDRQEGYKTFFARERVVPVKELPPHPLRDMVPVGQYVLRENLTKQSVAVNNSFKYLFQLEGEGNLAAIMPPVPAATTGLEFYPPDLRQDVTRQAGHVIGSKSFSYAAMAREPGEYNLGEALQFIYFNTATATYDTLRATMKVQVTGSRDADAQILSRDLGPFYKIIENEDATLVSLHLFDEVKRYTNIILLVLLAVSGFIFLKRKKL